MTRWAFVDGLWRPSDRLTPGIGGIRRADRRGTFAMRGGVPAAVIGGGGGSNEPGGMTVLANNQFTHAPPVGSSVAFTGESPWFINNPGSGGGAPGYARLEAGGGLEYVYLNGQNQAGGSPATTYMDSITTAYKTVYAKTLWTVSSPWTYSPNGVNKILYLGMASSGDIYLFLDGGPAPYVISIEPELPSDVRRIGGSTSVTFGVQHTIEWLLQYGPSNGASADGVVKWWLDGVLQGNVTNVFFPTGGFGEFQIYGGTGLTVPAQDQWYDYNLVHVSAKT